MPLLFSYGTLQQEDVQMATFGRRLTGIRDELPGFEQTVATVGTRQHANVTFNGNDESRVAGTAFEVSDADVARADEFEAPFSYERISAVLASGRRAWVYVFSDR